MQIVKLNGIYVGEMTTVNKAALPELATWPDSVILAASLSVKVNGVNHLGTKTITRSVIAGETGKHTITIDCAGVAAGSMIELSGEYYIDSVRYYFATEIYVEASPTIQKIAEADQRFLLDGGVYKLVVYETGTETEILTRKNIKQLDGTNMTSPSTQVLGGFQEP